MFLTIKGVLSFGLTLAVTNGKLVNAYEKFWMTCASLSHKLHLNNSLCLF